VRGSESCERREQKVGRQQQTQAQERQQRWALEPNAEPGAERCQKARHLNWVQRRAVYLGRR
jgi:hypothetical protein